MKVLASLLLAVFPLSTQQASLPSEILILDFRPQIVSRVIARMEGWGSLDSKVRRLRNPCALIFVGQLGARLGEDGYAAFRSVSDGWEACEADLRVKYRMHFTTREIARLWSADPVRYETLFFQIWNQETPWNLQK